MKKILAVAMIAIFLVSLGGTAIAGPSQPERIPVIVVFKERPDAALVRAHGGGIKYTYHIIPGIACSLSQSAIDALTKNPNIAYIEADGVVHAIDAELDSSWGVEHIGAGIVHEYNKGTGVKVAIIDTGIDYTHPDLDANYKGGYDFVNDDADPMDDNGHGTHCAGIVAAEDNEIGVIGVAPEAHLYAVKVLDSSGSGYLSDVIAGIDWSVSNDLQIISLSLGTDTDYQSLHDACDRAYNSGIVLVAAAGNDGNPPGRGDNVDYPGAYNSVIAVAAIDDADARARQSSTGPAVELSAPGVDILSTYLGDYAYGSGTSMACPHVTGTVALAMMSYSTYDNVQIRTLLQTTADDLGAAGFDTKYGYGLVDADEAAPNTAPAEPDTTAPTILGVAVTDITSSSATVIWTTDEASDSAVNYGTTTSLGSTTSDTTLTTGHSITLTGLIAETTYYFEVQSTDSSGNTATDDNGGTYYSFTTGSAPSNTIHVSSIDMWYRGAGPNYFVYTKVKIVDSDGGAVEGATVYLEMTLPGGAKASGSGDTGSDGTVTFKYGPTRATGTYTSTVTNVELSGWVWDGVEASSSITI